MNIASWSVWRLLAMWASWLFVVSAVLVAVIAILVRRLRDSAPVAASGQADYMNGFAIPIPMTALRVVLLLSLLPPALLTAVWLWQRFGTRH